MMKNLLFVFLFTLACSPMWSQLFEDAAYLLPNAYNSGNCVGFVDMDNDGLDDIVVLDQSNTVKVLYQVTAGSFEEVDYGAISTNNQWGMTIADYDNDGHKDVFSGGAYDGVHMKNINPGGEWSDFDLENGSMFMQACNFADIDGDGQLDVFGCHDDALSRMWRADGEALIFDASLIDLTDYDYTNYPSTDHSGNYGTVFSDFDQDGDIDLTIAKCRQFVNDPFDPRRINQLWMNNGDGSWTEVAADRGLVLNEQSWTVDYADIDNDGDWDCFITNHSTTMKLLENDGSGFFTDVTVEAGLDFSGFVLQAKLADFDNDGFVDVIVAGGLHRVYQNNGDGTFTEVSLFPGSDTMHSFALGDVNRDGTIDLYASYGNGYNSPDNGNDDRLWLNTGNDNHWIAFDLQGIVSNHDAVGTRVELTGSFGTMVREVRSGESYGITNSFACMFGLGAHEAVDVATFHWPSGTVTTVENPEVDQYHTAVEAECVVPITLELSGSTTPCPGETLMITTLEEFDSYDWSDGTSGASLLIYESGTYTVIATDETGCTAISEPISVEFIEPTIPEITVAGEEVFCSGESVQLSASDGAGWLWSNGEATQVLNVDESGVYTVVVTDACGSQNQSNPTEIVVVPTPDEPSVQWPDSVWANEPFSLVSTSDATAWYDSELASIPFFTGSTLDTVLSSSTELWVENFSDSEAASATGGRSAMGTGQYHDNSVRWLLFDVYESMVIESVEVFANEAGPREIGVIDANGEVLVSSIIELADGPNTIPLGFEVEPGVNYGLRSFDDNPQLWRDGVGTEMAYPYPLGDMGAITQSTAGGNNATSYYYFFYNWVVSQPEVVCHSNRIPLSIELISEGCTDESACNYQPLAAVDDGGCTYPGCMDASAVNYDWNAGCPGGCIYLDYSCDEIGDEAWLQLPSGVFPQQQGIILGVDTTTDVVFHTAATLFDAASQVTYGIAFFEFAAWSGLPEGLGIDVPAASSSPESQVCMQLTGMPAEVGVFYPVLSGEMFISLFGQPFSIGTQEFSFELTIVAGEDPITGCTYLTAANFNPFATVDNGSCSFPGCLDPEALNFSPHFNVDGGGCIYDSGNPDCPSDITGDGVVTVGDLLELLSSFGEECE